LVVDVDVEGVEEGVVGGSGEGIESCRAAAVVAAVGGDAERAVRGGEGGFGDVAVTISLREKSELFRCKNERRRRRRKSEAKKTNGKKSFFFSV